MPRMASTRNTEWNRNRARPASRELASQTPVLLRLPIVQSLVADEAERQPLPASTASPMTHASLVSGANVSASPTFAPPTIVPPPVTAQPSHIPVANTASSQATSASWSQPTQQAAAFQTAASAPTDNASLAPVATAAPLASVEPHRTWWEHWSSGVVLILLIIALVAASIIALNDGNKNQAEQYANAPQPEFVGDFDLSQIQIPDITLAPAVPTPVQPQLQTELAAEVQTQRIQPNQVAVDEYQGILAPPVASNAVASSDEPQLDSQPAPQAVSNSPLAPNSATSSVGEMSLAANGGGGDQPLQGQPQQGQPHQGQPQQGLELESIDLSAQVVQHAPSEASSVEGTGTEPGQEQSNMPTKLPVPTSPQVSLAQPIGFQAPKLFEPTTMPQAPHKSDVPTHTASSPANLMQPVGASPTLYDGAASPVQQSVTAGTPTTTGLPVDTNLPSLSALLTSSSAQPTFTTASHSQPVMTTPSPNTTPNTTLMTPVTASVATPSPVLPAVTPSATPELDAAAIIQAYSRYIEINKSQNEVSPNRYSTPVPTNMPTSPSTSGGFTLGAPQ